MGLISKTVMVKWHNKNREWYISKGYVYTKMKEEFEVKIDDLPHSSQVKVIVTCDCPNCTTPILKPIQWQNYLSQVKPDGKNYCQNCAMKLYGKENISKGCLKNGTSFERWCIDNNRQEFLDRWDYELNECLPSETNYGTKEKYYFKCVRGLHESELKSINNITNGHKGTIDCNKCNSFAQWGIDNICKDFLKKYWDYDKNNVDPWEISYGNNKKVWIKCQEKDYHGSYDIKCLHFTGMNSRCSYCGNFKVHPLDSLGKLLEDRGLLHIWGDKNKKSPYEYAINSNKVVWWKCPNEEHEDYKRKINGSNNYNFRCPKCVQERKESFLQEKVRLYLESLNSGKYMILHEYGCTIIPRNPKAKDKRGQMPFDNEVKELKLIIEVHGEQHYNICKWTKKHAKRKNTTPEYELHMQQVRDRYKRIYAKSKGYEYLEIPYWADDKDETWKQLIDNKINEIITDIQEVI
jgi:hypothetical protein